MVPRLIVAMLALAMSACSLLRPHVEQPTVTVVGIDLRGGNLLRQTFAVKLNVRNPNDRALPVKELRFTLSVDGDPVADGVNDRAFVVPANGTVDFVVSVNASLATVLLKLAGKRQSHADTLNYDLTGSASVELPWLRTFAFHQGGSLPLGGFLSN